MSTDFSFSINCVRFSIRNQTGLPAMTMTDQGKLDGEKIVGPVKMSGEPMKIPMKWNASRVR